MGQKIHPKSVRLGYIQDWDSKWFNLREMPDFIEEDYRIRQYVKGKLSLAAVARVCIERAGKYLRVNVYTARPGIVIGKGGAGIETLRAEIEKMTSRKTFVNVMEIKRPELDAQLTADGIAMQLEKQVSFRRAMKRTIEKSMAAGALGIKIQVSGRLGGAEIARREWLKEGRVPLQTFRADIHYGFAEAFTTMGLIGVKVWIFRKELLKKSEKELFEEAKLIEKDKTQVMPEKTESVVKQEPTIAVQEGK
ncbi:MAG: 30S ribosomal protein S3 [Endomicrobiales bacterium]|jgi:small subunit ribosomal protein S3